MPVCRGESSALVSCGLRVGDVVIGWIACLTSGHRVVPSRNTSIRSDVRPLQAVEVPPGTARLLPLNTRQPMSLVNV